MASVVVEKPYKFVPPHRGDLWPSLIQKFKLYEPHLRKKDGVVDWEIRNSELLAQSLDSGHGIMLAPNHCRYADPLVLGWLAKHVKTHVFAMASWHLFNMGWMNSFSIQKMGAFSVNREGLDKQSIETAIEALVSAKRPLVLFAEGATFRSNDRLQPLLDGASFIARTAARRRAKKFDGKVVIHPVAIKYVFQGDIKSWADTVLTRIESHMTWTIRRELTIRERISRAAEGLLALKEIEYLGTVVSGSTHHRKDVLIDRLIGMLENKWNTSSDASVSTMTRIKGLRTVMLRALLDDNTDTSEKGAVRDDLKTVELSQQLASFPKGYLQDPPVTETRILETLENIEENLFGKSSWPGPLKAIIQVDDAIAVPPEKSPKGEPDVILEQISASLNGMLGELAKESPLVCESQGL